MIGESNFPLFLKKTIIPRVLIDFFVVSQALSFVICREGHFAFPPEQGGTKGLTKIGLICSPQALLYKIRLGMEYLYLDFIFLSAYLWYIGRKTLQEKSISNRHLHSSCHIKNQMNFSILIPGMLEQILHARELWA